MKIWVFSCLILLFLTTSFLVVVKGEVDKTGSVTYLVDGDTFDISYTDRIRLADIDAPESHEVGYADSKNYLKSLIEGEYVFLDVDDVYIYDYSGTGDRFVCVAYINYNSTHYLNVNKAMVTSSYAVIDDFYNEFDPYSWSLFVLKSGSPTPSPKPTPSFTPSSTATQEPTPTRSPSSGPIPNPILTPTPSITPSPTPLPPIRFYNPYLILFGSTLLLIVLGVLTYFKKYKK